jgi:hypothetical protein
VREVKSRRAAYGAFISAAVAVLLLAILATLIGGWDAVNAIGTWLGGLGTVAAFGAALVLVYREADRDAEREADRRRQQAEQIAAWYDYEGEVIDVGTGAAITGSPPIQWTDTIFVFNGSNLPVFSVQPLPRLRDRPADDTVGLSPSVTIIEVLPPGKTEKINVERLRHLDLDPIVDLTFRDNAGRWWYRESGALRQFMPTEPS